LTSDYIEYITHTHHRNYIRMRQSKAGTHMMYIYVLRMSVIFLQDSCKSCKTGLHEAKQPFFPTKIQILYMEIVHDLCQTTKSLAHFLHILIL